jgi:hypothetical protein
MDLFPNNAGRGSLSPFLVLLGGLTNVTESIYVEEGSINGPDYSCDKVNWSSGEEIFRSFNLIGSPGGLKQEYTLEDEVDDIEDNGVHVFDFFWMMESGGTKQHLMMATEGEGQS